jgi:hypothetical protein
MAFYLAQAGNKLYSVNQATGVGTELTLPTGVTLSTTRKPRFALLGETMVMVNSPSRNLAIDPDGTVRVLVPAPPMQPPVLSTQSTGLTGSYTVRCSFIVLGRDNILLSESPLSPVSNTLSVTNQGILMTGIPVSKDSISGVRVYRTTNGGSDYYQWVDKDGNIGGNLFDNLADASLTLLPTDPGTLLTPPGTVEGTRLKHIIEWQNRLWAADDDIERRDYVYYTEVNSSFKWPNTLVAQPRGTDKEGIIGFIPRKNELGLVKRDGVWQIVGTGPTNYRVVQIAGGDKRAPGFGGCVATDSCIVVDNVGYWLGKDGIYEWSDRGIQNITKDKVNAWMTTDTYFNRSRFPYAFAGYNSQQDMVYFFLAAAASSAEDRWIGWSRRYQAWYGPHKTGLFTPNATMLVEDSNNLPTLLVGGTNGVLYKANRATRTDGAATAIDMDVYGKAHDEKTPDIKKLWGQMSMMTKVQASGSLTITPLIGDDVDTLVAETAMTHDLTTGRERLDRPGVGEVMQLRFQQATNAVDTTLLGYEVPNHELGRR